MRRILVAAFLASGLSLMSGASMAGTDGVPFANVDPNAAQPTAATEEQRANLQVEIFKAPGLYDPSWIQIDKNALRSAGRNADADTLALFAVLRKGTYSAICGNPYRYYGKKERNAHKAAIADLIFWQKSGRQEVDLSRALESALQMDAAAPFAYRPTEGWCPKAFDRTPKQGANDAQAWESVKLRDPAAFQAEHVRQREALKATVLSVIDASKLSRAKGLADFVVGSPGAAGTPQAQAFLAIFKPSTTLVPQNGEYSAIGSFAGISSDGSAIKFGSVIDAFQFYVRLNDQKRLPISEGSVFIAGRNTLTVVNISRSLCADDPAQQAKSCVGMVQYSLRTDVKEPIKQFSLPVLELTPSLYWTRQIVDYDKSSSMALISAIGVLSNSPKNPGARQALMMPPEPAARALIVVDLLKGVIVKTVTDTSAPRLFWRPDEPLRCRLCVEREGSTSPCIRGPGPDRRRSVSVEPC